MTVVEVTLVTAILLLLAAIALPAFFQNQTRQRAARCGMQLDAISSACRRHASERGGFPRDLSALVPDFLSEVPVCPAGGAYTLGTPEGDPPTCSVPGHHL
jgi:type II secretory pathway pseudopilin PulG